MKVLHFLEIMVLIEVVPQSCRALRDYFLQLLSERLTSGLGGFSAKANKVSEHHDVHLPVLLQVCGVQPAEVDSNIWM